MFQRFVISRGRPQARRRQRGVYALEWAVVFAIFFMLLYAITGFGLGFLVRESMQWATEDAARSALQHQISRELRKTHAKEVLLNRLSWLPPSLLATVEQGDNFSFMICRLNDSTSCTPDLSTGGLTCDIDAGKPCMLQVRLSLPYAKHSFTPSLTLGLLEIALPNLQAQAQILVDQKGF